MRVLKLPFLIHSALAQLVHKQTRSYLTFPQLESSHFEVQSPSTFIV
jgi:hypothetical protein